ncbi:MAG: sulfotransferase [Opitutales bacterium]|nr:sulfotransferase [Opitutales bacterium]
MPGYKQIVIVGAPRSGTTLLRVLLGRHSRIFALPETPWIAGGYTDVSIRHLEDFLLNNPKGSKQLIQADPIAIKAALRKLLDATLTTDLTLQKPSIEFIAVKTPDDAGFPDFLLDYFPDAYFLHITRDGRDVALSTIEAFSKPGVAKVMAEGHGLLTFWNVLQRWRYFETQIKRIKDAGKAYYRIKYEDLVSDPDERMRQVFDWLQLEPEPVSNPGSEISPQEILPEHEAGSRDVNRQRSVNVSSRERWPRLLHPNTHSKIDQEFGEFLNESGYPPCCAAAARPEPSNPLFMSSIERLHSPYPLSHCRFHIRKIRPFLRDLIPALRKEVSKCIHRHFWEDKRPHP